VDFLIARGDGDGLAAVGRDEKELGHVFVFIFVSVFALLRAAFVAVFFLPSSASGSAASALRSERKAIHWPSGDHCGRSRARIASRHETAGCRAIEPELFAEDLLVPVGPFGSMTTELPSGETLTASKLTELKNSSRVSLGFAAWAWARIAAQKIDVNDKAGWIVA